MIYCKYFLSSHHYIVHVIMNYKSAIFGTMLLNILVLVVNVVVTIYYYYQYNKSYLLQIIIMIINVVIIVIFIGFYREYRKKKTLTKLYKTIILVLFSVTILLIIVTAFMTIFLSPLSKLPKPKIDIENTVQRLGLMLNWFVFPMTDATNRFYYFYFPNQQNKVHQKSPIRELATAHDSGQLVQFFTSNEYGNLIDMNSSRYYVTLCDSLKQTIFNTIQYYLKPQINENTQNIDYGNLIYYKSKYNIENQIETKDCAYIDSEILFQPSTIAHSAFFIFAVLTAYNINIMNIDNNFIENTVAYMINGILNNQYLGNEKSDLLGAFNIDFVTEQEPNYYKNIEFYPAEAILSLLLYYEYLKNLSNSPPNLSSPNIQKSSLDNQSAKNKQIQILNAVYYAFKFYSKYYYTGKIKSDLLIFFSNWQTQAFSLFFQILWKIDTSPTLNFNVDVTIKDIKRYIFTLQTAVINSLTFKSLGNNNYDKLATVEVACGLESLTYALEIAYKVEPTDIAKQICVSIKHAMLFLNEVQVFENNKRGIGGFGQSLSNNTQRIDVTGHVSNAYLKIIKLMTSKLNQKNIIFRYFMEHG